MKYKEFINNIINTRGRFNCEGYHERHHILPECLNDPDYRERILSKNRRAVRCIELNMVFKSIDEATKYFNKSCLHMAEVIRNNRLCCGYHWEYVKEA